MKGIRGVTCLGELLFIGLGLHDQKYLSLAGLEEAKKANAVFLETYTSLMPKLSMQELESLIGKHISIVSRQDLEQEEGRVILNEASKGKAALLVPGDPLIATTHVDLRIRAERQGIKTHVIHGASIISAAIGLSGLQNYKFGKSVTVPWSEGGHISEAPYRAILENRMMGLHTLCFLDIRAEEKRYMTVRECLEELLNVEKTKRSHTITLDTLAVGIARAGSFDPTVKAGYVKELLDYEFGGPPHTLIFPARLHFMEAEALITLAKAPEEIMEKVE